MVDIKFRTVSPLSDAKGTWEVSDEFVIFNLFKLGGSRTQHIFKYAWFICTAAIFY